MFNSAKTYLWCGLMLLSVAHMVGALPRSATRKRKLQCEARHESEGASQEENMKKFQATIVAFVLFPFGALYAADSGTRSPVARSNPRRSSNDVGTGSRRTMLDAASREKLARLRTGTAANRLELVDQMNWDRSNLEGALLSLMRDPDSPKEAVFAAAFLLGTYRLESPATLEELTQRITLENADYNKDPDRVSGIGRYPLQGALIGIGQPSVRFMIVNLETSDDDKVRALSADVIRFVQGDREVARFIVEQAIRKQTDAKKKQRLQAALRYFADDQAAGLKYYLSSRAKVNG